MNPIASDVAAGQYQIAVARKQLDAIEQDGRNAMELIHSATPPPGAEGPPANVTQGIGSKLNFTA
jgi:hypothetical protein